MHHRTRSIVANGQRSGFAVAPIPVLCRWADAVDAENAIRPAQRATPAYRTSRPPDSVPGACQGPWIQAVIAPPESKDGRSGGAGGPACAGAYLNPLFNGQASARSTHRNLLSSDPAKSAEAMERIRTHDPSLVQQDLQPPPGPGQQRTHRGPEQPDQEDQADRLRFPQFRELPDPSPALRRKADLARLGIDRRPMRRWTPPESEEREVQVFRLVAVGLISNEIATKLFQS